MQDRNFDDIADKFSHNIYGTTKGKIRQAVLWYDLEILLSQLPSRPLRILDAGGGEGLMACQLAALGHQVTLCDLSSEMIQRAATLVQEENLQQQMQFVHCAAQDIAQHTGQRFDLILFHAVLEWIAAPQAALQALIDCLTPEGALSLMFFNANGLVMRNAILGNFRMALSGERRRRKQSLSPLYPLSPPEVYQWIEQAGMTISAKTGVRVFHDYLQNRKQQSEDFAELLMLEQRYCRQEPFVSLGRYIHVVAHNPLADTLGVTDKTMMADNIKAKEER